MSQVCQSGQGANANARAVETESDDPGEEEYKEIQHVWAMSMCNTSGYPGRQIWRKSFSGAGETCGFLWLAGDVWVNLLCNLLKCACAVPLVTTWECLEVLLCVVGVRTSWWS